MALCPPFGVPLGVHKVKQLLVLGWGAVSSQPQHLHPTIQGWAALLASQVDLGFFPLRETGSRNKDPLPKVTAEGCCSWREPGPSANWS